MDSLGFDIAHLLSGGMLVLSLLLLYQDRIIAVINVFALQAIVLALSVAWQAYLQNAPHLMVTAAIALVVKGFIIPFALQRIVRRLDIHREIETVIGAGPTMLTGLALVALSILLLQPGEGSVLTREDLAFALAVILLGLLMMITRRNAVTQIVGFMSLENGLVLAATGASGMPLVVEISVAFSILIAFIVFGIFVFRIRERFDTVDVGAHRSLPRRAEGTRCDLPRRCAAAHPGDRDPGPRAGQQLSARRRSQRDRLRRVVRRRALRCCSSERDAQRSDHRRRFQHLSRSR